MTDNLTPDELVQREHKILCSPSFLAPFAESHHSYELRYEFPWLSPIIAQLLVVQATKTRHGRLCIDRIESISVEAARQLGSINGAYLSLNGLKTISSEVAHELVKAETRWLVLDGITHLAQDSAAELAKFPGDLSLNGLTQYSVAVCCALASHAGDVLRLGIVDLSEAIARVLSEYEGWLRIDSLPRITRAAAGWLANGSCCGMTFESLRGLSTFRPEEYRLALRTVDQPLTFQNRNRPRTVNLNCVSDLSAQFAEELIDQCNRVHVGDIKLGGLTELSTAAATFLAKSKNPLLLSGLRQINSECSIALSRCVSPIHFGALATLDDNIANLELARSLIRLEDRQCRASHLLEHLPELPLSITREVCDHSWQVTLSALKTLTQDVAIALTENRSNSRSLDFRAVSELRDDVAGILANFPGEISLPALRLLESTPGHLALATKLGAQLGKPFRTFESWDLNQLAPLAANRIVAAVQMPSVSGRLLLRLPSMSEISTELAVELSEFPGELELGIKRMPAGAGQAFAKGKATLHLPELQELTSSKADIELARRFFKATETTKTNSLCTVADGALAEMVNLDSGVACHLNLRSLQTVSDKGAEILAKHFGYLELGVKHLSQAAANSLAETNAELNLSQICLLPDTPSHLKLTRKLAQQPASIDSSTSSYYSLEELSDSVAEILAGSLTAQLKLPRIATLSDHAADSIAEFRGHSIDLSTLSDISDYAAKRLTFAIGTIWVCFNRLPRSVISIFSQSTNVRDISGS